MQETQSINDAAREAGQIQVIAYSYKFYGGAEYGHHVIASVSTEGQAQIALNRWACEKRIGTVYNASLRSARAMLADGRVLGAEGHGKRSDRCKLKDRAYNKPPVWRVEHTRLEDGWMSYDTLSELRAALSKLKGRIKVARWVSPDGTSYVEISSAIIVH